MTRTQSLSLICWLAGALGAQAAERLVIISPHWEGIRYEYGRAFSEWHETRYGTPVEVDWRDLGGASDDLRFVISEFKQKHNGIGIDLFFGGGLDPYLELAGRGLLQAYRPAEPILSKIPRTVGGVPVYDAEFRWFGTALSSFGILYNRRLMELRGWPQLDTWRELAERAPVGSVGSGDPRNSGSTHMVYEIILQRYGWDEGWKLITQLAAKIRAFDRAASAAAKDVVAGNTAYALTIDFYGLTQIAYAGPENLGFSLPADCVAINPDSIAILCGAPNLRVAQRFVDFAISEPGQELLLVPRGRPGGAQRFSIERMGILPELYERHRQVTLVKINPFAQPVSFPYDAKKGSARWDIVNGLIGATIIDVHPELVAAWKRAGTHAIDKFGAPPVSEAEADALAAGRWANARYRQRQLIEWQRWAQQKFRNLQ